MTAVRLLTLTHDFQKRRSIALLVWSDDPEKKIAVPVPYQCGVNDVFTEAQRAIEALRTELLAVKIEPH